MGSYFSTQTDSTNTNAVNNVKKLFKLDENVDILDSLDIADLRETVNVGSVDKIPLPIIGGKKEELNNSNGYNFMLGGAKDIRFKSDRQRYLRYNIFKVISQLEEFEKIQQKGGADINLNNGNNDDEDDDEKYQSITSDNKAIDHIKKLINNELQNLKNNQRGGNCDCDTQKGGAKKKSKKNNKKNATKGPVSQQQSYSDSDSDTSTTDSVSGSGSDSSSSDSDSLGTDNGSNQSESGVSSTMSSEQGGLSIFPFNSSEVKSSHSEKNMKMIRRKI
jgi:hypothetical protein